MIGLHPKREAHMDEALTKKLARQARIAENLMDHIRVLSAENTLLRSHMHSIRHANALAAARDMAEAVLRMIDRVSVADLDS